MDNNTITITLHDYEKMQEKVRFLECLRMAGVDNWDGYEMAIEFYDGSDDE